MKFLSRAYSRGTKAAVLAAVIAATTLGASAPASAASEPQPNGCPPDPGYTFGDVHEQLADMVPAAMAQGGQTVTIAITAGASITGTVGGNVSGDVSAIVASAKVQVNADIALQLSASVSYSSSWTVPSNVQWGALHAGAQMKSMNWYFGSYNGACKYTIWRSGNARLAYHIPAFWH
jgi:hypothetical protein